MDFSTLKNKIEKDLHDMLAQKRDELREFRHKDSEKQLKTVRLIRKTRKEIAQILTELKKRSELALSADINVGINKD